MNETAFAVLLGSAAICWVLGHMLFKIAMVLAMICQILDESRRP